VDGVGHFFVNFFFEYHQGSALVFALRWIVLLCDVVRHVRALYVFGCGCVHVCVNYDRLGFFFGSLFAVFPFIFSGEASH